MTWLLRLYPRAWRRRYEAEVAEMLAGRAFSLRVAVDLIAGAIDTRLHPTATLAAAIAAQPLPTKEKPMLSRMFRLDCAAWTDPSLTIADYLRSAGALIGWTALLTFAWIGLRSRVHDRHLVDALSSLPFLSATVYSMRYTYLKGRSAAVQAIFIGGFTLVMLMILLSAGWIAAQI